MASQKSFDYHSMLIFRKDYFNPRRLFEDDIPGCVNTWDDWHLIPTSRPVFAYPERKEKIIDIPGSNGILDLSKSLTNYTMYKNREGTLEFIVANHQWPSWINANSEIANFLSDEEFRIVLLDDLSYFYEGTLEASDWKSNNDGTWSNITLKYNLYPYKMYILSTGDDWLWDPFNFETGIINTEEFKDIRVDGFKNVHFYNDAMPVVPEFYFHPTETEMTVTSNGYTITCPANWITTKKDPRLYLKPGENTIEIHGSGVVTIDFRMGRL